MITTHNVRIATSNEPKIKRLIANGQLIPSHDMISGLPGGDVYAPAPGVAAQLAPKNYHTLAIGQQMLQAQLSRLPEYELTALLEHCQAAGFRSYKLHELLPMLMLGHERNPEESDQFVDSFIDSLSAGPQKNLLPLVDERWLGGLWLPGATRFVFHDEQPFLVLGFELPVGRDDEDAELRRPVGIDVGLSPLITYATKHSVTSSGSISPVTAAERRAITAGAAARGISEAVVKQQIELLNYAAARALLELHLLFIRTSASVAYVEKLNLKTFRSDFVERGRELAVIDFISSWLPQRMHVEHVQVEGIDPRYTSMTCAVCHLSGTREGKIFRCDKCSHVANADVNAAQVMLAAGMAYTLTRRVKRRK